MGAERQDRPGIIGEGTYDAKVDTTLPERAQRRWEKKGDGANGDE